MRTRPSYSPDDNAGGSGVILANSATPPADAIPVKGKIQVIGDDQGYYPAAMDYLATDPATAGIISKVTAAGGVVTIDLASSSRTWVFQDDTWHIRWNPLEAIRDSATNATITPALGLYHEFGHASLGYERITALGAQKRCCGYHTENEYYVTTEIENPIARDLSEGVRRSHTGCFVTVSGPTARAFPGGCP